MKKSPTVDMNTNAANLSTVVTTWTAPMFLTPDRLMIAGIHRPTRTSSTDTSRLWSVLTNSST